MFLFIVVYFLCELRVEARSISVLFGSGSCLIAVKLRLQTAAGVAVKRYNVAPP